MTLAFVILALLTVSSGIAAMMLRNLVHCALSLSITFAGLAGLYLQLDAQFVGFAQILVYVGAVAILIVFAILLTRGSDPESESRYSSNRWLGLGVAVVVFAVVAGAILSSKALGRQQVPAPEATVRQLGDQLMTRYVLPLEVLGLLLTVALIGAVIIAMQEKEPKAPGGPK
jgi:NADH:ubiquinone oxidoreductase subunit 6 (subunit J)